MIDLSRETPVTLREAPALVPTINAVPGMEARKPLHPRTVYNWATRGKRGVKLETAPIGGILVTSREALQRFFARLAVARETRFAEQEHDTQRRRSSRHRTKEYQAARMRLATEHGI